MFNFKVLFTAYDYTDRFDAEWDALILNGIELVVKNNKHSKPFVNYKYVKKVKGKFHKTHGTISYPVLMPTDRGVTITVKGFPCYPKLDQVDILGNPLYCIENGYVKIVDIVKCKEVFK